MAALKESESNGLSINSHQTALCLIPPAHLCQDINRLRALYDRAYDIWPAHINVIYPFVAPENVPHAAELIRSRLASLGRDSASRDIHLRLDKPDRFSQKRGDIIYTSPSDSGGGLSLKLLQSAILEPFKQNGNARAYCPHLTLGQSKSQDTSQRESLLDKARLLPPIEWNLQEFVVLVRERSNGLGNGSSQMKIWGTIDLAGNAVSRVEISGDEESCTVGGQQIGGDMVKSDGVPKVEPRITYHFPPAAAAWEPAQSPAMVSSDEEMPTTLDISSYNLLVDSTYPLAQDRHALLIRDLLSESALADILVLQEVSDTFLSYLLRDDIIRSRYPFATHGPSDQLEVGPLPSLRNIVVLSRWWFTWGWLPFENRHKGAVILELGVIGKRRDSAFTPLIVAGVHLTSGLTDSSVAAKKLQLQTLLNFLSRNYVENPWIIAGDFNLITSSFTINEALKHKTISPQTADVISSMEAIISDAQLSDAWCIARTEMGEALSPFQISNENLYEGEQGATFDPTGNPLAGESVGRMSNNYRPQRYDRVLFKGRDFLSVVGFNMFGFPEDAAIHAYHSRSEAQDASSHYGSDHWGIRAILRTSPYPVTEPLDNLDDQLALLQVRKAPSRLADISELKLCLAEHSILPTDEEVHKRNEAFALLRNVLQQDSSQGSGDAIDNDRSSISILVVPVGSYGLGVWATSSDIDCLCVGPISSKTFFALANQRLRKAAELGVRILRKVKATFGTMLELDIRDIKVDLQYCPAAKIVERWPEVTQLPPSDPLFDLSILALTKLQAYRDLAYLQRTIPDVATFRTAHRFIKAWATRHGIYSSTFGYLGGIHITLMLSRLYKCLSRGAGTITAADIICTFFNHYANFPWETQMAYDPFFYKKPPRYRRYAKEPMVILTLHTPIINVARTASVASVRTIVEELKRADDLISGNVATWGSIVAGVGKERGVIDVVTGADAFLKSYNSYIKINVQYWGLSLAKGSSVLGWLESRCSMLLVDLDKSLADIHARIWPARFTLSDASTDKDEREYQGCYLIGLRKKEDAEASSMTKLDRKQAQGVLQTILDRFAEQIHNDKKYFDATSTWIDVTHIKQAELGDLRLDDRQWGVYVVQEESDTEGEEDEDDLDLEDDEDAEAAFFAKQKTRQGGSKTTKKPANAKKLRPAGDILNRLRWDPSFDKSDYMVGYEDRFLGAKETSLDQWKTENTDEEFIPQHRIIYFRRKSDGLIVWDRETRKDEIFGSGAGKGE